MAAERLIAYWELMRGLGEVQRAGVAVFSDAQQEFHPLVEFPGPLTLQGLQGNAFLVRSGFAITTIFRVWNRFRIDEICSLFGGYGTALP